MTSKNGVHDFFFCASFVEEEKNPRKPLRLFPNHSLDIRNWDEPTSVKGNVGLQLMSPTMPEKPLLGSRSKTIMKSVKGGFHHRDIGVSSMFPMDSSYATFQPPYSANDETLDQVEAAGVVEKANGPEKKRRHPKALKSLKAKKGKRGPQVPKPDGSPSAQRGRSAKKTAEILINGISMDISVFPIPYKTAWYKDRREKNEFRSFKKVFEKLPGEGYVLSNRIDLRTHWAKHGTDKFVTISLSCFKLFDARENDV
ncbi:hypothetical protein Peur_034541 [Populus x canadensis]